MAFQRLTRTMVVAVAVLAMLMAVRGRLGDGECTTTILCSPGFCCSKWGYCGTGDAYCAPGNCASQCPKFSPPTPGDIVPGRLGDGECSATKLCSPGFCCSKWGYCGTGDAYCAPGNCASQCPKYSPPTLGDIAPGRLGDGECSTTKLCSGGFCCSKWGYCGTGDAYCAPGNCASQCPKYSPPTAGDIVPGRLGDGECSTTKLCSPGFCCSKWGYCGTGDAYCAPGNCASQCPKSSPPTPGDIITYEVFEQMLPRRNTPACHAVNFYTYSSFIEAAKSFPEFGFGTNNVTQKRELAAFFAQTSHQTTDPDQASENFLIAFKTAMWFWMAPQAPKPSCHEVMVGSWVPSAADNAANRLPGFGLTTNIINGGFECGNGENTEQEDRIGYYKRYCDMLGVSYGDNLDCNSQTPYGRAMHLRSHGSPAVSQALVA